MDDEKFPIIPEPTSAPGDFYVDTNCCTACGVPQAVAPDLVGWTNEEKYPQCRWLKQPSTPEELERAFTIFDSQEFNCHRYRGADIEIQKRVGLENCGPRLQSAIPGDSQSIERMLKRRPPIWSKKWRRKR